MRPEQLAPFIDQTLLRPEAKEADLIRFIEASRVHPFAALCIPPCHVPLAARMLAGTGIRTCTVAGFPLGYGTTAAKVAEGIRAVEDGAEEVDMVMNISRLRSGAVDRVIEEIGQVVEALPGKVVKVIIETCYLSDGEKAAACRAVIDGGAAFVKTSTGFGPGGAAVADVRLLAGIAAGRIGVKASGGIKTLGEALSLIEAGATRIGTSRGGEILAVCREGAE